MHEDLCNLSLLMGLKYFFMIRMKLQLINTYMETLHQIIKCSSKVRFNELDC